MSAAKQPISQAHADYHLHLILDIAEDLFQRYGYLALWRIRWWTYEGFTDDYFHWPYARELRDISFIEEMVWVMKQTGHQIFVDAYESHLRQACRPVIKLLTDAEERVLMEAVCSDLNHGVTVTEIQTMIEGRLLHTIMSIAGGSDMEGIRDTWVSYGFAVETPDEEEA